MTYAQCVICITPQPLEAFRFLPCGHGFCTSCVDALKANVPRRRGPRRYSCPVCRKALQEGQEVKIHVEVLDGDESRAAAVEDQLGSLGVDSEAEDVGKSVQNLEGLISSGSNLTDGKLDAILACINEFKERIVPMFEQCKSHKSQVTTLKLNLSKSAQDYSKLVAQLRDKDRLKGELEVAQTGWRQAYQEAKKEKKLAEEAMETLEDANAKVVAIQQQNSGLEEQLQEKESSLKDLRRILQRQSHDMQRKADRVNDLQNQLAAMKHELNSIKKEKDLHICHSSPEPLCSLVGEEDDFSQTHQSQYRTSPPSHSSKRRRSLRIVEAESSPLAVTQVSFDDEAFFEEFPRPGFGSDWNLRDTSSGSSRGLKRKSAGVDENRKIRPFDLDRKGKPRSAVQLGPKRGVKLHFK